MQDFLYYFTGTGNSLALARNLSLKTGIPIAGNIARMIERPLPDQAERIGIICPVYAFNIPRIVRRFLKRIENEVRVEYLFLVLQAGGDHGNVTDKVRRAIRRFERTAAFTLFMPTNYIPFFDPVNEELAGELYARAEIRTAGIADTVREKKTLFDPKIDFHKVFLFPGIFYTLAYPFIRNLDRGFRLTEECIGCGICARVCPVGNIDLSSRKPVWKHSCEQCMACLHWCPSAAVQYGKNTMSRGRYHHPAVTLQDMIGTGQTADPPDLS